LKGRAWNEAESDNKNNAKTRRWLCSQKNGSQKNASRMFRLAQNIKSESSI
jgi:hypothetical protein